MKKAFSIQGNLVDVHQQKIYAAEIFVENERIVAIKNLTLNPSPKEREVNTQPSLNQDTNISNESYKSEDSLGALPFILPGFIDSHIHIESSMLIPSEFAKLAVVHGTVATVSDPHEIANVCGMKGVEFMIENGNTVPFKFNFGAPSCVPATTFETAGANIDANDINDLMRTDNNGKGYLNIVRLMNMQANPKLFSTFMLSLLSELYAKLPEEGDVIKPKLVIVFDEAHLIFTEEIDPSVGLQGFQVRRIAFNLGLSGAAFKEMTLFVHLTASV